MTTSRADFRRRLDVDVHVSSFSLGLVLLARRNDRSLAQGFGFVGPARARGDTSIISSSRAGATEPKNKRAAGHYGSRAALVLLLFAAGCSADAERAFGLFANLTGDAVDPDASASGLGADTAAETPVPMGDAASSTAIEAGLAADGGMAPSDASLDTPDAMLPAPDAAMDVSDAMLLDSDAALDAGMDRDAMPMQSEGDADAAISDPADEHCAMDMPVDPRDSMIESSRAVLWFSGRSVDVLLPQPVIDWLNERELQDAHDAWHLTRRWDDLCGASFAPAEGCDFAQSLIEENLWRAEYQQGAPGAGLAFLHMHRHMIHLLRTAFPAHARLFDGWSHVPRSRYDADNPTPWKDVTWSADNLIGFDILENIEDHVDQFANEDELGVFIENTFRWTPEAPVVSLGMEGSGVHGAMHNQWAVSGSPGDLGRTDTALLNYVFWKLHGFIDDVWSRYRIAKHLHDEDSAYQQVARQECRLMYFLAPAHRPEPPPASDSELKRGQ